MITVREETFEALTRLDWSSIILVRGTHLAKPYTTTKIPLN